MAEKLFNHLRLVCIVSFLLISPKKKKKRRLIFVVVVLLSQGRKLKSTEKFLLQASVLKAETLLDFPDSSAGKESTCNAEDPGSIPGWGRQPGEGTHSSVLGLPLWLSW